MIDIILVILSILGAILNCEGKVSGFYVWIIGNIMWIIYGYMTNQWHIVVVFAVYCVICIRGIYVWKAYMVKRIID